MKQLACLSLAALALALAAAPKPPRNGVLYYNSFDNSLTADYAAGQAAPMNAGRIPPIRTITHERT